MTAIRDMSDVPRYPSLLARESPSAPSWPRHTTGLETVACGVCGRVRAVGTPFCDHGAGAAPPARWKDSATLVTTRPPQPESLHNRRTRRRLVQVNVPVRRHGRPSRATAPEPVQGEVRTPVEDMSRDALRDELRESQQSVRGSADELRARLAAHRRTEEDRTQ